MNTHHQSGNVLFYIFIAVVLFGGLSFVMAQSGRGSLENITTERSKLAASEVVDYSDTVSKAVGLMRLRGMPLSSLRFSHADLPAGDYDAPGARPPTDEVFNTEGGNVVFRKPPVEAIIGTGGTFAFLNAIAIGEVGTDCLSPDCADIVMALGSIKEDVCRYINKMSDIGGSTGTPPAFAAFNTASRFKGAMATPVLYNNGLQGKLYGCLQNTGDSLYYFYRVLWAQ